MAGGTSQARPQLGLEHSPGGLVFGGHQLFSPERIQKLDVWDKVIFEGNFSLARKLGAIECFPRYLRNPLNRRMQIARRVLFHFFKGSIQLVHLPPEEVLIELDRRRPCARCGLFEKTGEKAHVICLVQHVLVELRTEVQRGVVLVGRDPRVEPEPLDVKIVVEVDNSFLEKLAFWSP